jgi:hypothetical protein
MRSPLALRLQLALAALGRGPLLLAAAAVLVLLLWLVLLPAAMSSRAAGIVELQAAQSAATGVRGAAAPAPAADGLTDFAARLASDEDVARLVQQIWRQGSAAGLQINKVDWRAEADAGLRFGRVQVTVPMSGSYSAMRRFVFGLMSAYPGLALDKLDMKREQASAGPVETTAHFTLYVQP